MSNRTALIASFLAVSLIAGCDAILPANSNPPAYIKQVTSYKEGSDGLVVYIVLADSAGAMTTASGTVNLKISQTVNDYENGHITKRSTRLFERAIDVTPVDFHRTTVGQGAFAHDALLLPFGRIAYSDLWIRPTESMGKVEVTFKTASGNSLTGEDTIFF